MRFSEVSNSSLDAEFSFSENFSAYADVPSRHLSPINNKLPWLESEYPNTDGNGVIKSVTGRMLFCSSFTNCFAFYD